MEQKKQIIIQILTKLKPYRNLAEGILALVESSHCTNQTIDGLTSLMQDSLRGVKKERETKMIQKGLEKIQEIKHREEEEKMSDHDIDKLLADIE